MGTLQHAASRRVPAFSLTAPSLPLSCVCTVQSLVVLLVPVTSGGPYFCGVMEPLHLSLQAIDTLLDPLYWLNVCPFLTVALPPLHPPPASDLAEDAARAAALCAHGFFRVSAAGTGVPPLLISALERGVHRLVALGHAPSAITMYAEAWAVGAARLTGMAAPASCEPPSAACAKAQTLGTQVARRGTVTQAE